MPADQVIDDRLLFAAELHVAENPSQEVYSRGHWVIPGIEKQSVAGKAPGRASMPGNGNDSAPEATKGASLARAMVSCITVIKVALS